MDRSRAIKTILILSIIYFAFGSFLFTYALDKLSKNRALILPNNFPVKYSFESNDFTINNVECLVGNGASMLPTFSKNNLVCWKKASLDEISPGNIIVFMEEKSLVAHRAKSINKNEITTQGDNNNLQESINASQLLGVVVLVVYS